MQTKTKQVYIVFFLQVSWIRHKDTHLLTAGRLVNTDDIKDDDLGHHLKYDDDMKDDDHLEFVCYLFQTRSFWAETNIFLVIILRFCTSQN